MKKASESIRKGDKFESKWTGIWEIIAVHPFGKLELFNREKVLFQDRSCREMRTWKRV